MSSVSIAKPASPNPSAASRFRNGQPPSGTSSRSNHHLFLSRRVVKQRTIPANRGQEKSDVEMSRVLAASETAAPALTKPAPPGRIR
jgi:hypothetical protein